MWVLSHLSFVMIVFIQRFPANEFNVKYAISQLNSYTVQISCLNTWVMQSEQLHYCSQLRTRTHSCWTILNFEAFLTMLLFYSIFRCDNHKTIVWRNLSSSTCTKLFIFVCILISYSGNKKLFPTKWNTMFIDWCVLMYFTSLFFCSLLPRARERHPSNHM